MDYNVDDMTGVRRPRTRRLLLVGAILLPVIVVVGTAAWFIRSYVLPPTMTIEPRAIASAVATPAAEPQTTGTSPPAATSDLPLPTVRYTTDSAEVWAAVPLPGPPRSVQPMPEAAVTTGEPVDGPVPLPPRRPRVSDSDVNGAVPLPRPRPTLASN